MGKTDAESARRMVGGRTGETFREGLRGDDFYATPPEAVKGLLSVEHFDGPIWEPACGDGAISRVLSEAGYTVVSTDLVERGYGEGRIDFLMERKSLAPNIVTNPPYKNGVEFAEHAVELASQKVAFLMRLVWLEGARRQKFFTKTPLARVWVFSKRIPRMNRHDYDGPTVASSIAFAWFVWDHGHDGPPVLGWI